jgi:hypothetical protein
MPLYYPSVNISVGGNTQGTTSIINSGTATFVGGSNITLSEGSQGITIIGNPQGFQGYQGNIGAQGYPGAGITNGFNITIGGNTAGTNALINSGTATIAGGNNITLSQNNNAITVNANLLNYYNPTPIHGAGMGNGLFGMNPGGVSSLFPFEVGAGVAAEYAAVVAQQIFSTYGTNAFSQTCTWQWGIYYRPGGTNTSQLYLSGGSNSFSFAFAYSNSSLTCTQVTTTYAGGSYGTGTTSSGGLSISSAYNGPFMMLLGLNSTLLPGQYWFCLGVRTSGTSNASTIGFVGISNQIACCVGFASNLSPIGSTFNSSVVFSPFESNWPICLYTHTIAATALNSTIGSGNLTRAASNLNYNLFLYFNSRV